MIDIYVFVQHYSNNIFTCERRTFNITRYLHLEHRIIIVTKREFASSQIEIPHSTETIVTHTSYLKPIVLKFFSPKSNSFRTVQS